MIITTKSLSDKELSKFAEDSTSGLLIQVFYNKVISEEGVDTESSSADLRSRLEILSDGFEYKLFDKYACQKYVFIPLDNSSDIKFVMDALVYSCLTKVNEHPIPSFVYQYVFKAKDEWVQSSYRIINVELSPYI